MAAQLFRISLADPLKTQNSSWGVSANWDQLNWAPFIRIVSGVVGLLAELLSIDEEEFAAQKLLRQDEEMCHVTIICNLNPTHALDEFTSKLVDLAIESFLFAIFAQNHAQFAASQEGAYAERLVPALAQHVKAFLTSYGGMRVPGAFFLHGRSSHRLISGRIAPKPSAATTAAAETELVGRVTTVSLSDRIVGIETGERKKEFLVHFHERLSFIALKELLGESDNVRFKIRQITKGTKVSMELTEIIGHASTSASDQKV